MKGIFLLLVVAFASQSLSASLDRKQKDFLYAGTGIIVGAVSGAITGYLVNTCRDPRGKKGSTGPKGDIGPKGDMGPQGNVGPQGASGERGDMGPQGEKGENGKDNFTIDEGASLSFKFSVLVGKVPPFGTMVVPFVSTPDGRVFNGSMISIGGQTQINLGYISVDDPTLGSYHLGIQLFTTSSGFDEQILNLIVEATASQNDKIVTTILEQVEFIEFQSNDQTQITVEYTYSHDMP